MIRRKKTRAGIVTVAVAVALLLTGACSSSSTGTTGTSTGGTSLGSTPKFPETGDAAKITVIDTPFGKALAGNSGKVLYGWDVEPAGGDAVCVTQECFEKWPPFNATSIASAEGIDVARLSLLPRLDGTKQVAIDGQRLYYMSADEPGEANCQGLEGWYIRNADGSKNTTTTATK